MVVAPALRRVAALVEDLASGEIGWDPQWLAEIAAAFNAAAISPGSEDEKAEEDGAHTWPVY